jgi:hypothetical protein
MIYLLLLKTKQNSSSYIELPCTFNFEKRAKIVII